MQWLNFYVLEVSSRRGSTVLFYVKNYNQIFVPILIIAVTKANTQKSSSFLVNIFTIPYKMNIFYTYLDKTKIHVTFSENCGKIKKPNQPYIHYFLSLLSHSLLLQLAWKRGNRQKHTECTFVKVYLFLYNKSKSLFQYNMQYLTYT